MICGNESVLLQHDRCAENFQLPITRQNRHTRRAVRLKAKPTSTIAWHTWTTTPPLRWIPCVLDTMAPMFSGKFGNPSSMHRTGRKAADLVYEVRDQVAEAGFGWRRIQCCQKNNGSRTGHKEMNPRRTTARHRIPAWSGTH